MTEYLSQFSFPPLIGANQKKTDYICISKESEGPAPDALDETLPNWKLDVELYYSRNIDWYESIID